MVEPTSTKYYWELASYEEVVDRISRVLDSGLPYLQRQLLARDRASDRHAIVFISHYRRGFY